MSCELSESKPVDARLAGDISKATGSAKVVLVGSGITAAGGIIAIVAPPVSTVVGGIVAAVGALVGIAGKLFGNKWHQSSGVRWLLQKYQFYVMGDTAATSSNHVNEAMLQEALNWFTAVLGVPIYDKYRYHALAGEDAGSGKMIMPLQSYNQRAVAYMAFPEAKDVSFDNAVLAAHLADQFDESGIAGSWSEFKIAPHYFSSLQCSEKTGQGLLEPTFDTEILNPTNTSFSFSSLIPKVSFWPLLFALVGLFLFLENLSNKILKLQTMRFYRLFHQLVTRFSAMDESEAVSLHGEAEKSYMDEVAEAKSKKANNIKRAELIAANAAAPSKDFVAPKEEILTAGNRLALLAETWYMRYGFAISYIVAVPAVRDYMNGESGSDEDNDEDAEMMDMLKMMQKYKKYKKS